MKRTLIFLALVSLLTLACQAVEQTQPPTESTPPTPPPQATPQTNPPPESPNDQSAVLLFTIGMHIEPMGETAQGFKSGKGNYNAPGFFQRHVEDIETLAKIIESHGGVMTIQAQSPFTTAAIASGNTILADLAARGHEIALHFHEDAHLGKNAEELPLEQWCAVMKEEISFIQEASGVEHVRYWSGGNLYPDLFEAAACAGLEVNSDWKNPNTQTTDLALVGVHPWRPSGGTDGVDLTAFTTHNPDGPVVFLPEGMYDQENFASMRRSEETGGDQAYFDYLAESLYASLEAAEPGMVNVFHFTVHPGEFRGDPQHPFEVIERFLTEVVDPLVAEGRVQWATYSQMADAYAQWEAMQP